jgi:hypothetical protein
VTIELAIHSHSAPIFHLRRISIARKKNPSFTWRHTWHLWDFLGVGYMHKISKKGALDSQPQVIKFTSCLPVVGGSLRFLPPLKLVINQSYQKLFFFTEIWEEIYSKEYISSNCILYVRRNFKNVTIELAIFLIIGTKSSNDSSSVCAIITSLSSSIVLIWTECKDVVSNVR